MPDANEQLEVYLKDHYAGGVGALELIEHSIKTHEGTPLAAFFEELRGDVKADHEQLHNLMTTLGFEGSGVRDAGAWMAEKLGRAKFGFSGGETSGLRLVQTLESLFSASLESNCSGALCTQRGIRRRSCSERTSSIWRSAPSNNWKGSKRSGAQQRKNF
jgi:hypothetical protein